MFSTNDRVKTPLGVGTITEAVPGSMAGDGTRDTYRVKLDAGGETPILAVTSYIHARGTQRAYVTWFVGKRYHGMMSMLDRRPTDDPRYTRGAH